MHYLRVNCDRDPLSWLENSTKTVWKHRKNIVDTTRAWLYVYVFSTCLTYHPTHFSTLLVRGRVYCCLRVFHGLKYRLVSLGTGGGYKYLNRHGRYSLSQPFIHDGRNRQEVFVTDEGGLNFQTISLLTANQILIDSFPLQANSNTLNVANERKSSRLKDKPESSQYPPGWRSRIRVWVTARHVVGLSWQLHPCRAVDV